MRPAEDPSGPNHPAGGGPERLCARARRFAAVAMLCLLCGAGAASAKKPSGALPWNVRVDVFWGAKKNREVYRAEFAHAVASELIDHACFQRVLTEGTADLVLEIQLNEFITEQDYYSNDGMMPGQGEIHDLRSATATVNLDYWLKPEGQESADLQNGHIYRQVTREPQTPTDPAEERALHELTLDISRWVARDLCGHSSHILQKGNEALTPKKP